MTPKPKSNSDTDIALIKQDIGFIKDSVKDINNSISNNYTPLAVHNALKSRVDNLIRIITYLVLLIAAGLIGGVLKLVLK